MMIQTRKEEFTKLHNLGPEELSQEPHNVGPGPVTVRPTQERLQVNKPALLSGSSDLKETHT